MSRLSRRIRFSTVLAILAAIPLLATSPLSAQAPQFRSTVEIVQLQVGVTGAGGAFVAGLEPGDFVLRVNGVERPVQVVYEVDLSAPAASAVTTVAAGPTPEAPRPAAARRHFLLLFDFSFTSRRGVLEARSSALEFLREQVHDEDLVAVATYNRFGFSLLAPFTSDHATAASAVETLGLVNADDTVTSSVGFEESISQALAEMAAGPAGDDGGIGAMIAGSEFAAYVAEVTNYAEQMQALGELLQAIEGRKHVVLFSRGFDDRAITGQSLGELSGGAAARASSPGGVAGSDAEQMYGSADVRDALQSMIETFRSADAVVHAVDPSGLRQADNDASRQSSPIAASAFGGGGDLNTGNLRNGHQSLIAMAEGTGGTISWGLNDLGPALERIERSTAAFYMIGYRKSPDDPPTVEVRVEVRAAGVRVTSAPTLLTPPPAYERMSDAQRQMQLAEFLADSVDRRDVAFEAQIVPFPESDERGKLAVVLEVPGIELDRLATERGEDRIQLEFAALARGVGSEQGGAVRRGLTVDVGRMRQAGPMTDQRVRLSDYIEVPPGDYRVRLLVREREVGRLSTRTLGAHLPGPPEGRIAVARPLILAGASSYSRDTGEAFNPLLIGDRELIPEASPVLAPGRTFRALLIVYHLPRDPVSGEVQAGVVLEIDGSDGATRPVRDFEIVGSRHDAATDVTQLLIQGTVPPGMPTGNAQLWARIRDTMTGARVEEQTALYVADGGA